MPANFPDDPDDGQIFTIKRNFIFIEGSGWQKTATEYEGEDDGGEPDPGGGGTGAFAMHFTRGVEFTERPAFGTLGSHFTKYVPPPADPDGRYARLLFSRSYNNTASIALGELEVSETVGGADIGSGFVVTGGSYAYPGYPFDSLRDGATNPVSWASYPNGTNQYIDLDFGADVHIAEIRMAPRSDVPGEAPYDMTLLMLVDGEYIFSRFWNDTTMGAGGWTANVFKAFTT